MPDLSILVSPFSLYCDCAVLLAIGFLLLVFPLELLCCVFKPTVDGDPHFMIELPEQEDALCFNIDDTPGTIFNLVKDPQSGEPTDTTPVLAHLEVTNMLF